MRFIDMLKTVIAERVITAVLDKVSSGRRNKGSMYPFRLPKESTAKKSPNKPNRTEIKNLVTNYFSSPEGKHWQDHIITAGKNKTLYHADATKLVRDIENKATRALLKKMGLA